MLINCPSCGTLYRISGDKLGLEERKLRCSRCGHIFLASVYHAQAEEEEKKGTGRKKEQAESTSVLDAIGMEESRGPGRRGRGRLWLGIMGFLLAAVLGYYLFSGMSLRHPFVQEASSPVKSQQGQRSTSQGAIEDIALRDVSQYMVQNEHMGTLLVIEGEAENESGGPKKRIELQATILDKQGKALRSKEFPCGNSVSLVQLQSLGRQELKSAFHSEGNGLSKAQPVDRGEALPFMGIFFSPPEKMAEFSLGVHRVLSTGTS
ncbi:MAG: zinc-ribbon domain-containing protein [Desulfohalobiaceae bacterium]|nr:zinc-ribbon domain-containing protein [Desulfohalobiaceae bacterium]